MSRRPRAFGVLLKAGFQADAVRTSALLAITLGGAVGGALNALWIKLLVDGVVNGERQPIVVAAIGLGASLTFLWMAFLANYTISTRVNEATGHLLQRRLVGAALGPEGIAHHERPETMAKVERVRGRVDELGRAGAAIAWNGGTALGLLSVVGLLAMVHPLLLLLPVVALPSVVAANRAQRFVNGMEEEAALPRRAARSLFDVATTAGPAKEVRLFGLRRPLAERHAGIWSGIEAHEAAVRRRAIAWDVAGAVLFGLGYLAALGFVGLEVLGGRATAGDLILTFVLAGQVSAQVGGIIWTFPNLLRTLTLIGLLLELEEELAPPRTASVPPRTASSPVPPRTASVPAPPRAAAPERLADGIRLDGVTFRYPGTDLAVLDGVDLRLPAGSTVALVGDNGAGKSTLVKLLCGLYPPTGGRVLVDGHDLTGIDLADWRTRISAGFQDFVRFELPVRTSVGVGDLPRADDDEAVRAALAQAGADDVVAGLPGGWDTLLGRSFEGGHEPSGGQWQKLALGRAMMRPAPLLLVLDEPTSSLDAETEYRLFARYAAAARRVTAANGGITLLVTHRFSTVRMADRIVVLDGGRVVEQGGHDELIARGGLYAELYELQARAYR